MWPSGLADFDPCLCSQRTLRGFSGGSQGPTESRLGYLGLPSQINVTLAWNMATPTEHLMRLSADMVSL